MPGALALIESIAASRATLRRDPPRFAQLARLQAWQIERLRRTYADLAADPQYADALEFFVSDLYGPHEFAQRDADLRRMLHSWEHLLPARAAHAVIAALELEALTLALDLVMLDTLAGAEVTHAAYAQAYRRMDRQADRERQIHLAVSAGRALDELIRKPVVRTALRFARTPARIAGVLTLHEFLERGFNAFAKMRKAAPLLDAIAQRESRLMNRLLNDEPAPFDPPTPERR